MKQIQLTIAHITATTEMQARCTLCSSVADDYAERMLAGDKFPPIVVFNDGKKFYLADGFHRLAACIKNGDEKILADVHDGTQLDALKYSIGANRTHGLCRTNADKRRCVSLALEHFAEMSNVAIAEKVGVSESLVRGLRDGQQPDLVSNEVTQLPPAQPATRIGRDGVRRPASVAKATTIQADNQILAAIKALWSQATKVDRDAFVAWRALQ